MQWLVAVVTWLCSWVQPLCAELGQLELFHPIPQWGHYSLSHLLMGLVPCPWGHLGWLG